MNQFAIGSSGILGLVVCDRLGGPSCKVLARRSLEIPQTRKPVIPDKSSGRRYPRGDRAPRSKKKCEALVSVRLSAKATNELLDADGPERRSGILSGKRDREAISALLEGSGLRLLAHCRYDERRVES